jgi:KRAB domain-containing zinc finger protein
MNTFSHRVCDCVSPGNFQRHTRNTHTKERPYTCDSCDYASADSGAIKRHARQHSNERPAVCTYAGCTYTATDFSNLSRHLRTHTGERPFGCPASGCSYTAAQSSSVQSHVRRRHSDHRPFSCAECIYAAKTDADLKKHKLRLHGM